MECKKEETKAYICMLLVTNACNLNCIYCYESHKSNRRMPITIAKNAIKKAFEVPGFDYVSVQFMGGEPLLEFPLIKEISVWMWNNSFSKPYELFASTNGTLLDDNMKSWFYENRDKISLGISFDGTTAIQDFNRTSSSSKIDLDFFLKTWPNLFVKMTVSTYSIGHLADSVLFLESKGFKNIKTDLAYMKGWTDEHLKIWDEQLKELVEYYSNHENHCSLLDTKIELVFANQVASKRCGCGEDIVCVDVDGKEYPCQMYSPISMDYNIYSRVKDIDFSDHSNFEIVECKNCILHSCCPACNGCNLKYNGSINKVDPFYCKAFIIQFMRTLDYRFKLAERIEDLQMKQDTIHDLNEIANVLTLNI